MSISIVGLAVATAAGRVFSGTYRARHTARPLGWTHNGYGQVLERHILRGHGFGFAQGDLARCAARRACASIVEPGLEPVPTIGGRTGQSDDGVFVKIGAPRYHWAA